MAYYRLKHNFTAGELSPLMNSRVDLSRFRNGSKVLENAICMSQGPATRRPGLEFVIDLADVGLDEGISGPLGYEDIRMVPFIFNEEESYVLIFYPHTGGGVRVVFGYTGGQDTAGLIRYTDDLFKQTVTVIFAGTEEYTIPYPPGSTVTSYEVFHVDAGGTQTKLTDSTDYTIAFNDTTGSSIIDVTATYPDVYGEYLQAEYVIDASAISGQVISLAMPAGWDTNSFDWAQSGDEMYIAQAGLQPYIIQRWGEYSWNVAAVTMFNQPGDWNDNNGWPQRVTFHQQRLIYAANATHRQKIWASVAGDFSNFGIDNADGITRTVADGFAFTLDSGTQNAIQWIVSGASLVVGTLGDEWTVTGSDRAALVYNNILTQRRTNTGSEPIKPLLIGLSVVYLERHGRTANEFIYDINYDNYKATDLSILSPHITDHYRIVRWAYQQTPDSIVWSIRSDGALVGLTYQQHHEVVGWHRHTTDGYFIAMSVIPGATREDDVWVVVRRDLPDLSGSRYCVEKMSDWFIQDEAEDGRFLDSYVDYRPESYNPVLTGLDHLEDKSVDILANGMVFPNQTVTNGGVELPDLGIYYTNVVVGLPYTTTIRPHLMDVTSDRVGTSLGRSQRVSGLAIDIYKSLGMWMGRISSDDGEEEEYSEEQPFRRPSDLMDTAVPLWTGIYTMTFPEGYDEKTDYYIQQRQPLPLTVRGITDSVEVFE